MEKEFVPYELALRMKQLGFDEECFYVKPLKEKTEFFYTPSDYDDFPEQKELEVGIPLYQQAFRWFREKYYMFHEVFIDCEPKVGVPLEEDLMFSFTIHLVKEDKLVCGSRNEYQTHEEAKLACLKKLIEIVEEKNKEEL